MPREGNGTPLQHSCLENLMDGGAWWAAVHGVAKSWTRLSDFTFTFPFHALEKEMATQSSVLAWRIPGMGKPCGLPSMGLHRVRHDRSDLAIVMVINFMCLFSSVAQSSPTLYNLVNCSMPGLPVHHQLPEATQTHVLWVDDAIQPSHPLSSPSPPALNPSVICVSLEKCLVIYFLYWPFKHIKL